MSSTTTVSIESALLDPKLLGAALGTSTTWSTWLAALKAAFGLKLTRSERRAFKSVAGSRKPPKRRVQEFWCIAGRGSGKSRMTAAVGVYTAAFLKHDLDPGEVGYVLVLAGSRDQAQAVFSYALAFFRKSPILRKLLKSTTAHEIRLKNGVTIAVHTNSFRLIRGKTLLATIFDEIAFWRDDTSANPDLEVYRAVRPSLARTGGMLIGISSPYRRAGLLHQKYKDHFDANDDDILVVHGPTTTFNPTIDKRVIAKQYAADPESARSEWGAEFRSDLSSLLDQAVIDDTIDYGRPLELPPRSGSRYHCFVDASAGRHDSFALCIGHLEGAKGEETFVADVVRSRKAPFDPRSVAHEYAQLARDYGCTTIIGDNFAGEWVSGEFRDAGARYEKTPVPKSTLYLESLPYFNRGCVSGPDHSDLVKELRDLERRTHRSGKDTVDHPKRGSDDLANAFCGCMYVAFKETRRPKMMQGVIDFAKTGRVTWNDNGERPRLRFEVITEKQDLLRRGLEVSGPAKPKNGLAP